MKNDVLTGVREQFPILDQEVNGHPLVYFDNAATTQKPTRVVQALVDYYYGYNANIHRGIHTLAEKATRAYEHTRELAAVFVNAPEKEEIIFVRGVTEAVNLVASSYGQAFLKAGDEIIVSGLEHHSNIVPWQLIAQAKRATLRVIPVLADGQLDLAAFSTTLSKSTRIVAVNHASNSLGTINPVKQITTMAHNAGAVVLIDGAQAAAHLPTDVQDIGCDFYCVSGHKMYGPTGAGFLYGKRSLLESMPPYMGGGEMIRDVSWKGTTFNDIPYKFEAGTPNIADVIALGEAISFINDLGKSWIHQREEELRKKLASGLKAIGQVQLIGTAPEMVPLQSFLIQGIHPFDAGQLLDARGIAVRTGHHCTQPLMDTLGIDGTVRASLAVYNTAEEIDHLIESIERIIKKLLK